MHGMCRSSLGRSPGASGISRSPECLWLAPWGRLTQDLKSINLLAIKNTSPLLSLIYMSERCWVVSSDSFQGPWT